jgi:hypothetical protein
LLTLAFSVGLRSWPGHRVTSFLGYGNDNFTTNVPIVLGRFHAILGSPLVRGSDRAECQPAPSIRICRSSPHINC